MAKDANISLSVWLRSQTRKAHLASEAAMDLERRLASSSAYMDMLVRLRGAYEILVQDPETLHAERLLGQPGRLQSDLSRLVQDLGEPLRPEAGGREPMFANLQEGIGAIYVAAGSRLGGHVIGRMIRQRLPLAPARFFAGDADNPGPAWRAFKLELNRWGAAHREEWNAVMAGAGKAFSLVERALLDPSRVDQR